MYQSEKPIAPSGEHILGAIHEGLSIRLVPAPISKRIMAYMIDMGIVMGLLYLFFIFGAVVFGLSVAALAATSFENLLGVVLIVILIILAILVVASIYHGYFIYFESKKGYTLGKKVFGISVVTISGGKASFGQCVLRDFFRYLDCALIVPGLLSITLTDNKQRIGDLVAATLVVHSARNENSHDHLYLERDQYQYLRNALQAREVPLAIAKTFLTFAYQYFIAAPQGYYATERPRWIEQAKSYIDICAHPEMKDELLLRFFAEHCFQRANNN